MRSLLLSLSLALVAISPALAAAKAPSQQPPALCAACVHADMDFLASDELHGRGSGTRDEHLAATFTASLFESFGLEPAGDNGTWFERAPLPSPLPDRLAERLKSKGLDENQRSDTWNTLALLRGTDTAPAPAIPKEVILLTAHQDHLGLGNPVNGDSIYNGADDDASGTTAVLELARVLSKGPRPKRSILFVLFGSEELGGYGNRYFLEHSPVPLTGIVANLEFEMMGRPDPALPTRTLWLTGYDLSNLGPELGKHGAPISADPHPEQHFFRRSDNYALAQKGIVAQTVSSYGLHKDYHQPSDELSKIDFDFMTKSIAAMQQPILWLANSGWRPQWNPGAQPQPAK